MIRIPLLHFFYIEAITSNIVFWKNNSKTSIMAILGVLVLVSVVAPAYADQVVKPTSAGTLNVGFETNPATPNPGDQTELKISFINKKDNTLQQHIDYKVSVTQGDNQVFGTQVTHTAEGAVSIPFQFQTAGTYQVTVEVQGILFQPIPPETASFDIVVGPAVPEFGPMAGMIIAISIVSVIAISRKVHI
ncbi:membrane hypothetical protein [Nitrosotalea sinensis]|uniref:PEFG-CTERM sorting domain-containing protein n=1 Tax=Nitrosotalea sinensis TaxID=1499975 RepID=A0A2H1EIV2_9ARCH|nr:membrane hypothetical protein [Candidatus Nitrosotalea sinensis]